MSGRVLTPTHEMVRAYEAETEFVQSPLNPAHVARLLKGSKPEYYSAEEHTSWPLYECHAVDMPDAV